MHSLHFYAAPPRPRTVRTPTQTAKARCGGRLAEVLGLVALLPSCLFYDSRWGEARKSQQRAAESLSGAAPKPRLGGPRLGGASGLTRAPATVTLSLRAYADASYTSQVLDWQHRFARTVEAANGILSSAGLEFQLVHTGRFDSGDGSLESAIVALERLDPADNGAWVVGLVGSRSLLDPSFRKLGLAQLGGQHLVLRQANDALEFDAIERIFTELSEDERAELYRRRRDHRAHSVLVHELGHALGAPHTGDDQDLMHPAYSIRRSRLGPQSIAAIAAGLGSRRARSTGALRARSASLQPPRGENPGPTRPRAETTLPAPAAGGVGLTGSDRSRLQRLHRLRAEGMQQQAWDTGQDLFSKYPNNPELAELHCQLAMELVLPWEQTKRACAALRGGNAW